MKLDKDQLKKHHFWILLGLVPVVVIVAVFAVSATVGAAIETKTKAVDDAKREIDGKTSVKSDPLIKLLDDQRSKLEEKKVDLWKENWERQIGVVRTIGADKKEVVTQVQDRNLLRWPTAQLLNRYAYTPDYATDKMQLKFGDPFPSSTKDELNQFKVREVYLAEFSNARPGFDGTGMADKVAPTEFLGGWQSVLRHISFPPVGAGGDNGWGPRVPTPEQVWLAMEDVWVQRALLGQVKAVNDSIGTFEPATLLDANNRELKSPTHRAFRSRNWRVELKVIADEKDRRPVLVGRIKNITDRLQPLGLGARMTLNVWLTGNKESRPFPFHIGGEFLRGGEEREIIRTEEHNVPDGLIPGGLPAAVISHVEQVFDTRTVPVRRIDALALGYKDSRHALMPLKMPKFESYKKEAEAEEAKNAGGAGGMGPPAGMVMSPTTASPTRGPGLMMPGAGGGAGGTVETIVDGNRKRYVEVTDQVRRMPVAVTVIVDQAYIQDVLIAYANSPLRFQTTQVHWKRFNGNLSGSSTESGGIGSGEGGPIVSSGQGSAGAGFGTFGEGGGSGVGRPPFGSSGGFGRGGPAGAAVGPGPGPMGPPLPVIGPMGSPLMPMGPGGVGSPGGTMTSISESQLTAGLVELTIYGIVSLYEKYQVGGDTPAAGATPTTPTTPTPAPAPTPPAPAPGPTPPPKL